MILRVTVKLYLRLERLADRRDNHANKHDTSDLPLAEVSNDDDDDEVNMIPFDSQDIDKQSTAPVNSDAMTGPTEEKIVFPAIDLPMVVPLLASQVNGDDEDLRLLDRQSSSSNSSRRDYHDILSMTALTREEIAQFQL